MTVPNASRNNALCVNFIFNRFNWYCSIGITPSSAEEPRRKATSLELLDLTSKRIASTPLEELFDDSADKISDILRQLSSGGNMDAAVDVS